MANFDDMAKAAKAKSESLVDEAAAAEKARQEANVKRISDAEAFLRENVLPLVEQAATAFASNGIEMKFDLGKAWRISSSRGAEPTEIRAINFHCETQVEGAERGPKVIRGDQYIFEHDGSSLSWKRFAGNGAGIRFSGGTVDEFVTPVIERALESYFEKLRSTPTRS